MNRPEIIVETAESLLGCPYIYGTWGKAVCTPSLRSRYASYNPSQKAITYKRCQRLRASSPVDTCDGCKYQGLLAFDCRGFTHYCLDKAGIEITGGYVGRQWTDANWDEKGDIAAMPDLVCCVFVYRDGKWAHTGLHVGGGQVIHCSGEVKRDTATGGANQWTHYAIPKGLYSAEEIKAAHHGGYTRMLKNGSTGEDVRELQEKLNALGYDCGTPDGLFGNLTAYAVKAFQRDHGLTVDGIVGPVTYAKIEEMIGGDSGEPEWVEAEPVETSEGAVAVDRDELVDLINQIEAMREQLDGLAYIARGWIE